MTQRVAYLAGPVAASPDRDGFAQAQAQLESEGFRVLNPLDHPRSVEGAEEAERMGQDYKRGPLYKLMLRDGLRSMLDAEVVYVMPGWRESNGARLEVYVATKIGMDVFEYARLPENRLRAHLVH